MNVPISWLKEYVDVVLPIPELAERLTLAGLEVEEIEIIGRAGAELPWDPDRIRVGEVVAVEPHPDADRLVLAVVNYGGDEAETCVTGAPNLLSYRGQDGLNLKVAFAMEGAELWDPYAETPKKMKLKRTKIRGVTSRAMVCSERELGLSDEHEGILFLPDDAPVGSPLADYLGDTVLLLDVTPNLARCFSIIGVAREVAALTGQTLRLSSLDVPVKGKQADKQVNIDIHDAHLCPRYIGMVIHGAEIGPAPFWMQRRLRMTGMRPINNVVDITNYVMLEWGQPLHAFDLDKLIERAGTGVPTIIVRPAKTGEKMITLDNEERDLTPDDLLICDTAGPIAIAGVMGGLETEVTEATQNILLEAANFHFLSIRRTSQRLRLPSEASGRFGRGIHPAMAERGALRAAHFFHHLADGTVAPGMADAYPAVPEPITLALTPGDAERILGLSLTASEMAEILTRLEFDCRVKGESVQVSPPDHRLDVECVADLLEDVARIYGYDRIPTTLIADALPPQRENRSLTVEEQIRDLMVEVGLQEVITYRSTTPDRDQAIIPPGIPLDDRPYVTLSNPISTDRTVLRHSVLASVLEVMAANLRFRDRVAVYEIGPAFLASEEGILPEERRRLVMALCGKRASSFRDGTDQGSFGFFDLKGMIEAMVDGLSLSDVAFVPVEHPGFRPGRTARMLIGGQPMGVLGELHPRVAQNCGLPAMPVLAADLDIEGILTKAPESRLVSPISRYPAVRQDIAVIVDEGVPAEEVRQTIEQAGGKLLQRIDLFDIYQGEQIGSGKKSLAYALTFQAADRTLTDSDANRVRDKIVRQLAEKVGASLRGVDD